MENILIISDPLEGFNIYSDTTYLLMVTAAHMKIKVSYSLKEDLFSVGNEVYAKTTDIEVTTTLESLYTEGSWYKICTQKDNQSLKRFTAVIVRCDPPFNMEYFYLTQLLELAEKEGVKVINSSYALRNCNEKLSILNFPSLIPPTLVGKDKKKMVSFIDEHELCVVKPLNLMAGREVFQVNIKDVNRDQILETVTRYFKRSIIVQKFIPEVIYGDQRIFIINGEVVPYCLCRIPQTGHIRANLAVGGHAEVRELTKSEHYLVQQLLPWFNINRIQFAGIDVIGNYLTEINITSPTGAHPLFNMANINITQLFLEKCCV